MGYRDDFKKEFPSIRPGFENDLEWANKGLDLLNKGKLKKAERQFKKLTLSQPEHPDGLEGLARTYRAMENREKALLFINDAIEMTTKLVASGEIAQELLDAQKELRTEIEQMPTNSTTGSS